jgi:hypothetical protein
MKVQCRNCKIFSGLFDKFAFDMYDRGGGTNVTKRARALFHINSILKNNQLNNKMAGLEEVTCYNNEILLS